MVDADDKLENFQAITGLQDPQLCTEILEAHAWDLDLAISSFTSSSSSSSSSSSNLHSSQPSQPPPPPPGLASKLIKLPVSVISGSLGLISGAIGFGLWAAGGVLSYPLTAVGFGGGRGGDSSSAAASEAMDFVAGFEREYGISSRPNFVREGFMEALERSRNAFKLLFVYLHSPDHPDTPLFCERTLCSEALVAFVNENFVSWGGSIRSSEGFKMSNSLKASRFPFCALVMPATNQRIALLQQGNLPTCVCSVQPSSGFRELKCRNLSAVSAKREVSLGTLTVSSCCSLIKLPFYPRYDYSSLP